MYTCLCVGLRNLNFSDILFSGCKFVKGTLTIFFIVTVINNSTNNFLIIIIIIVLVIHFKNPAIIK